ncbi:hypothetical protein PL81_13075, partial [Streptomyces sp. RSD-27]
MALAAPQFQARRDTAAVRTAAGRAGSVRAGLRLPGLATVLLGCGMALLPWMAVLAGTMPRTAEV